MADKLPKPYLKYIKSTFDSYDKDGNGKITFTEMETIMKEWRPSLTEDEIKAMIANQDADGSGTIEFPEYLTRAALFFSGSKTEGYLAAFNVFDKDGNGFITASELREVLAGFDLKMTDEEVEEMIKKYDIDKDGQVKFDEFAKMMSNIKP
ncbi:calmodulin-2-like [Ptychodera flava]|uniref:calmodulin-2-like n=1 Tax=Ptychodera flava TaxID=63121 RepID=UPI003969E835